MGQWLYRIGVVAGVVIVLGTGLRVAWQFRPVSYEIVTSVPNQRLVASTEVKHLTIDIDGKTITLNVPVTEYQLATETNVKTYSHNVTSVEFIRYVALLFVLILYGIYSIVVLFLWCRYQFCDPGSTAKHHAENTRKLDAILGFAAGTVVMLVGNIDMAPQRTIDGTSRTPIPVSAREIDHDVIPQSTVPNLAPSLQPSIDNQ